MCNTHFTLYADISSVHAVLHCSCTCNAVQFMGKGNLFDIGVIITDNFLITCHLHCKSSSLYTVYGGKALIVCG